MTTNIDRAVEVIRPLVIARNLTFTERAKRIARAADKRAEGVCTDGQDN